MREIVIDTETTGFKANHGDRLVEICCIELINHVVSGESFHRYINPERDMPDGAFQVHGLSSEFLSDKPVFVEVAEEIRAYLGDDKLIIHNASFDIGFLNAEFKKIGGEELPMEQAIDTLALARRKFPGAPASLDALCRRFEIDNSHRTLHGARLDAELLAEVYLELIGGRQPGLVLSTAATKAFETDEKQARIVREARPHAPSDDEKVAHTAFVNKINDPIWER